MDAWADKPTDRQTYSHYNRQTYSHYNIDVLYRADTIDVGRADEPPRPQRGHLAGQLPPNVQENTPYRYYRTLGVQYAIQYI